MEIVIVNIVKYRSLHFDKASKQEQEAGGQQPRDVAANTLFDKRQQQQTKRQRRDFR